MNAEAFSAITRSQLDWLMSHGATLRAIGGYWIVMQPGKTRRTYETPQYAIDAAMNETETV